MLRKVHLKFVDMFMINHMQDIPIKWKNKYRFYTVAMLLFYIQHKTCTYLEIYRHTEFQNPMLNGIIVHCEDGRWMELAQYHVQ
jgi:hypothetical protein